MAGRLRDVWQAIRIRVALWTDRHLATGRIRVRVEEGVARLEGHVRFEAQRMVAQFYAERTGVKQVINRIQVATRLPWRSERARAGALEDTPPVPRLKPRRRNARTTRRRLIA